MMSILLVSFFSALTLSVDAALRDVPLGECHGCEVTCFEDCALKYDREIMQELYLLQTEEEQNRAAKVTDEYANCLIEDKCPCDKEEKKAKAAKAAKGKSSLLQKKGNATCAVGDVP